MITKLINVADITLSQAFFVRESINHEVVDEYVEALAEKAVFPPIDVFAAGRGFILADGWHRVYAFRKAKRRSIIAQIHEGDSADCLRFSIQSNQDHGLRRSNADKRRCVRMALDKWSDMSGPDIAKLCGVSHTFVGKVRTTHEPPKPLPAPTGNGAPTKPAPKNRGAASIVDILTNRMAGTSPVDTVLDGMGYPVPDKVMDYWSRSFEVRSVLDMIEDLDRVIDLADCSKDLLWHEAVFQTARADLSRVRQNIETAMPYAVCTNCQGQLPETCALCGGKGFISKFRFETVVPEEIRDMRKKACVS